MTKPSVKPSTGVNAPGRAKISVRTLRTDRYWLEPALTFAGLTAWVLYALVRTSSQRAYFVPQYHYLSPFSSPCVSASCTPDARDFGTWFGHLPPFVPFALLVLPFLLGFRLTCYYYRKAYYRAFWQSPPACAVAEPHARYSGETRFPLILQNAHRYFFYAAIIVSLVNTYDAARAFRGANGDFGIGLGTIIMVFNVVMLWLYTASCHSCRHLIGGRLKHFSAHPVRYKAWTYVTKLNGKHMQLAWTTLGTLVLTDGYIALVASDTFKDLRFIN
ncbi:MAG: Conserved putative rane protein [Pseudonocardiales bacterium]|nr:Conserved putative rane protein [Pseudonocardiales bacterium]